MARFWRQLGRIAGVVAPFVPVLGTAVALINSNVQRIDNRREEGRVREQMQAAANQQAAAYQAQQNEFASQKRQVEQQQAAAQAELNRIKTKKEESTQKVSQGQQRANRRRISGGLFGENQNDGYSLNQGSLSTPLSRRMGG